MAMLIDEIWRMRHPSGRPIRRREQRALPIRRYPRDEYLTPRLNMRTTNAIGFRAHLTSDYGDEDDGQS